MTSVENESGSIAEYGRACTGVYGLDDVLHGGLHRGQLYLIEGDPGAGKTTLGLQFLIDGARQGERALYLTLAESRAELDHVAKSHNFDVSGISIEEIHPPDLATSPEQQYTVFHPSEVELADVMQTVINCIRQFEPKRLVIDSMSEFRMLARDPLRYRRQVLSLKQFLLGRGCTTLILDERMRESLETQLQTIAHGVIRLENIGRDYGIKRRRLEVLKVRASKFREGFHDYVIGRGGMRVFPRLVSGEHKFTVNSEGNLPSGIKELDDLFRGGVARGTSTLIIGPSGAGKSTISAKFVASAAERNEPAAIFTFDEVRKTYIQRSMGLGIDLDGYIEQGIVDLQQVDPAELSPGEFIHRIRQGVQEQGWKLIVIDSLNGLMNAMAGEQALTVQLHELLSYLSQVGVSSFLVMAQYGLLGQAMSSPADVSYLADNVLLLRYFEAAGDVRQAISVVKHRSGMHERSIRELTFRNGQIHIGQPLADFIGVLTGAPEYKGSSTPLS